MTIEPRSYAPIESDAFEKRFQEALGLWESGCRIWLAYVADCSTAFTPTALIEANARFVARCLEAPAIAAGEIQRDEGAPTLSA